MAEQYTVEAILTAVDKNFSDTFEKMDRLLEQTSKKAGPASGGFKGLFGTMAMAQTVGNMVAGAFSMVTSGITGLVGEAVSASDGLQKFESTMGFAGYKDNQIKQAQADVKAYADATVYDLNDIASMSSQLASNGISNFKDLTQAAGNLNAVAGGNAATFKSVGMVMTQTAGAGKLTTENWNQLADAIPGASGKLQEAMLKNGAYTGNFREAMEKGQISAEEFNQAVLQLGMTDVAKEAATSTKTIEGAVGNLQATVTSGLMGLVDKVKPHLTSFLGEVSTFAGQAFDTLNRWVDTGIQKVQEFFAGFEKSGALTSAQEAFDSVGQAIGKVVSALSDGNMSSIGETVGTAFKLVADAIKLIADAVNSLSPETIQLIASALVGVAAGFAAFSVVSTIAPIITSIIGLFTTFGGVIGVLQYGWALLCGAFFANPWGFVIAAVVGLIAFLVNLWNTNEGFRNACINAWEAIKQAFSSAWEWLVGVWEGASEWFSNLWNSIVTTATEVWNSFLTFIQPIVDQLKAMWDSLVAFFSNLWTTVTTSATTLWNNFLAGIAPIVEALKSLWQSLTVFFDQLWNIIVQVAMVIWNSLVAFVSGIVEGIKAVWQTLQPALEVIWQVIQTIVTTAINVIMTIIQTVMTVIQTIWSTIWNVIVAVLSAIWTTISTVVTTAINVVKEIIQAVSAAIEGDWESFWISVQQIAETIWNAIQSVVDTVINTISSIISSVMSAIQSTVDTVINAIKGIFDSGFNAMKSIVDTVGNALSSAFTSTLESMKGTVSGIIDGVKGIIEGIGNIDLFGAGKAIIDGFLNGLKSAYGAVQSFIGGIADWIAKNKGPISYDRKLLIPAGHAIMGGFDQALGAGFARVQNRVAGMAGGLQSRFVAGIQSDMAVQAEVGRVVQPAEIHFSLGGRDFSAFVEDISQAQGQAERIRLKSSRF